MIKTLLLGAACALSSGFAYAKDCAIEVRGTDTMQYHDDKGKQLKNISIPKSCKEFTVEFKHVGKLPAVAMGHNFIITRTQDVAKVVAASLKAGPTKAYRAGPIVAGSTKMLGGASNDTKSEKITFKTELLKTGNFTFLCTFPGHNAIMRGTIGVAN